MLKPATSILWTIGAIALSAAAPSPAAPAFGYSVVHAFTETDAHWPTSGVIALPDGSVVGGTNAGGSSDAGAIFRVWPDGTETVLHALVGVDGWELRTRPILASDGRLYGVASAGGAADAGTAWRMEVDGSNFTVLHAFSHAGGPSNPVAGPLEASDGNFYGMSQFDALGVGSLWRMTPSGEVTVMHEFRKKEGEEFEMLMQGSDGNLYGTASAGGSSNNGTFFRMGLDGSFKVIRSFDADLGVPTGDVVQEDDGDFLGAAQYGAAYGWGAIYRMKPDGTLSIVHTFGADTSQGLHPLNLMQAPNGMYYGTTAGDYYWNGIPGTVFRMNRHGEVTILHRFKDAKGGLSPFVESLASDADGYLYGTCTDGGHENFGTVFRISPTKLEHEASSNGDSPDR